jgi:hypothetical protein
MHKIETRKASQRDAITCRWLPEIFWINILTSERKTGGGGLWRLVRCVRRIDAYSSACFSLSISRFCDSTLSNKNHNEA